MQLMSHPSSTRRGVSTSHRTRKLVVNAVYTSILGDIDTGRLGSGFDHADCITGHQHLQHKNPGIYNLAWTTYEAISECSGRQLCHMELHMRQCKRM